MTTVTTNVPEIETDIPLPEALANGGRPRSSAYSPLAKLEVGQSFFVGKKLSTVKIYLGSAMIKALRAEGRKHVCADAEKAGVAGTRIWRTA